MKIEEAMAELDARHVEAMRRLEAEKERIRTMTPEELRAWALQRKGA